MNKSENTKLFSEENEAPREYSIFDHSDNEKKRLLYNDSNERTSGFLKVPVPKSHMRKSCPFDIDAKDEDERNKKSLSCSNAASFANWPPCLAVGDGEGNGLQNKELGIGSRNKITDDVQRRLQEQLAVKQREVQEIQQKIAKNKKWGDARRAPSQERIKKNPVSKLPTVRSCPDSLNQMPVFDVNQRRRKNDSFTPLNEIGSNLDPNSPCFYPSQLTMNNPIWPPIGGMRQDCGNERDFCPQRGNNFNPTYPATHSSGQSSSMLSADNNAMEKNTDGRIRFENDSTSFGCDDNNNEFGFVSRHANRQEDSKWNAIAHDVSGYNQSELGRKGSENNFQMSRPYGDSIHTKSLSIDHNNRSNDKCGTLSFQSIKKSHPFSYGSKQRDFSGQIKIAENVTQISQKRFDATKEDLASHASENSFNSFRMRIVRKRQDTTKPWRHNDQQLKYVNLNCLSCKGILIWPHIVSCLHSFCFSCIVKHFDKTMSQIKCPICSTVTELYDKTLQDLDLDFTMCNKLLQTNQPNPFSCMSCSEGKRASTYCQECMKYICFDCRKIHETNQTMSNHRLNHVTKVMEEMGKYVEVCSEHPAKKLDQYCQDCKRLVCSQCISLGESHGSHVIGDVNKLYQSAMNKIELMNNSMDDVQNEVQKRIQPLTILKQHIETSIRLCKQDIHKYSNSLLAEAEKCRTKARHVIDKAHEDFEKDITVAENCMTQYMSEYLPLMGFFRRYRLSANHQDFMSLAPSIQKRILSMNEKHTEVQKHEGIFDTNVSFKADYAGINEYLQNQYNGIQITENLSEALPNESSEMGRRIEKDILAGMESSSRHLSPQGSLDLLPISSSSCSSPENTDPQSEIFNYNRTAINFTHQFGKYGRGEYEFVEPSGVLYLLDESLAVCDTANHRIMVYDNNFTYVRTIGQPPNLPPLRDRKEAESSRSDKHFSRTQSCLYFPYRIAQCPQTENLVVIERPPSRDIQIFTVLGQFITCFGSDILQHPRGVAVDEHGVIVTVEGRTMKLMLFSQEGHLLQRFFLSVHLEFPNDIVAKAGLIYISDNRGHCVHVFDYNAEHKHTIGNESVTYYPIGVSLTHSNQIVVTDNHNTFNISVFKACPDGQYTFGFKSKVRHANCYNVAVHPHKLELAVTSRENQVVIFNFDPHREVDDEKDKQLDQAEVKFRKLL